jgi:hypothetical protein
VQNRYKKPVAKHHSKRHCSCDGKKQNHSGQ